MKTNLANEKEKIEFSTNLIFDRIINLKLKCGKSTADSDKLYEEFVIRSDYEMVGLGNGIQNKNKYIIRRCTHKPSIKVTCNMVSANTGTAIDIYISNFFLQTTDGKHIRGFSNKDYKILGVDIAMGYFGQFKGTVNNPKDFFDVKAINGADFIELKEATYVTTDKLPPDSVLHIRGMVGNIFTSPVKVPDTDVSYDDVESDPTVTSDTDLEKILFKYVTRRYLRSEYLKVNESLPEVDKNGFMSEDVAKEKGIKVVVSDEANKLTINKKIDSNNQKQNTIAYFEGGYTPSHTLAELFKDINPLLTYRFTNNGTLLVFTTKEGTDANLLNSMFNNKKKLFADSVFEKHYNNEIPAVYSINVDVLATIVCPFFSFIEPFQTLRFSSRYALTSLVSFYASTNPTVSEFVAIRVQVSFATVDNINEVMITAVSMDKNN